MLVGLASFEGAAHVPRLDAASYLRPHPFFKRTVPTFVSTHAAASAARAASNCGLLGPDLAAGIRRVKGVRRLRVRVGNRLTAEEGKKPLGTEM